MTITGQINYGTAGLTDLTAATYTDASLSTPTSHTIAFTDAGNGLYNESGTADDSTGWQVVSSATAGYSISGPIISGGGGGAGGGGGNTIAPVGLLSVQG